MLNKFWYISALALIVISANIGLSIPLRIALAANAVIILIDVFNGVRRLYNDCRKAKN